MMMLGGTGLPPKRESRDSAAIYDIGNDDEDDEQEGRRHGPLSSENHLAKDVDDDGEDDLKVGERQLTLELKKSEDDSIMDGTFSRGGGSSSQGNNTFSLHERHEGDENGGNDRNDTTL